MPSKSPRIPSYRHHKGSGQAFVQIKGKRHYLGKHGTAESKERYKRVVTELCTSPTAKQLVNKSPVERADGITIVELLAAYLDHLNRYNGRDTKNVKDIKPVLRVIKQLYGHTTATEFGPSKLKLVRQKSIELGHCRSYVNRNMTRIERMCRWSVAEELVAPHVYQAFQSLEGLRKGYCDVPEGKKVAPVAQQAVDATLLYLSSIVAESAAPFRGNRDMQAIWSRSSTSRSWPHQCGCNADLCGTGLEPSDSDCQRGRITNTTTRVLE